MKYLLYPILRCGDYDILKSMKTLSAINPLRSYWNLEFKNGTTIEWYEHIGAVLTSIGLSLFSFILFSSSTISPVEKSTRNSISPYSTLRKLMSFSLNSPINSVSGSLIWVGTLFSISNWIKKDY